MRHFGILTANTRISDQTFVVFWLGGFHKLLPLMGRLRYIIKILAIRYSSLLRMQHPCKTIHKVLIYLENRKYNLIPLEIIEGNIEFIKLTNMLDKTAQNIIPPNYELDICIKLNIPFLFIRTFYHMSRCYTFRCKKFNWKHQLKNFIDDM